MRNEEPRLIHLSEYRPPEFTIDDVHLDFQLGLERSVVKARLNIVRQGEGNADLRLDGEAIELLSVKLDDRVLPPNAYILSDDALIIPNVPDRFTLTVETAFSPRENKALSGIYVSNERICSQCEAEGFRRITYFLDRPDVLARYRVRIEADAERFPTLLSNGNLTASGEGANGRHWAEWEDPFPKPSYLFALVAGGYDRIDDAFTTLSGRVIPLHIYTDPGDAARASYAMDALKRSMSWDERVFGREYDLDLFMIVAVRDFNFGAMENKGLNIFNSALLLADPETATDFDYASIEAVIAHEYFHNWTGNRITCRDWFQLCLKEGLTVFRDQEFSADQRGRAVRRIADVQALRARQFPEDAGPLAHPVRPESYAKIDNFYTATVYEKGAELVRVLKTLIGPELFRRGMDHYFERCDGTAATVEDFLDCMSDASGRDLSNMLTWYRQPGTPRLKATVEYDEDAGLLGLTLSQSAAQIAGQSDKRPMPIPVRVGFIDEAGTPAPCRSVENENTLSSEERLLVLEETERTWRFAGFKRRPLVSLLRGFSAPVILEYDEPPTLRARRARVDPDLYNRWEATRTVVQDAVLGLASDPALKASTAYPKAINVFAAPLTDQGLDPAYAALALTAPHEQELAQLQTPVRPDQLETALKRFLTDVARLQRDALVSVHDLKPHGRAFSPEPAAAAQRALRNAALRILARLGPVEGGEIARERFVEANNLTDVMAALSALDASGAPAFEDALSSFYHHHSEQALLVDKWFSIQARSVRADAVERVERLLSHPDYDESAPNRARALLGGLAFGNFCAFHRADGAGYDLLADRILAIDANNPAIAARLAGAYEIWPRLEPTRAAAAQRALGRMADSAGLSRNLHEIVMKMLACAD